MVVLGETPRRRLRRQQRHLRPPLRLERTRPPRPSSASTSTRLYTQRYPAVATDADGDFVVTWDSRNQDGDAGNYGVFARRFDSAGTALATRVPGQHLHHQRAVLSRTRRGGRRRRLRGGLAELPGRQRPRDLRPALRLGRRARSPASFRSTSAHQPAPGTPVDRRRFGAGALPGGMDRQRSRRLAGYGVFARRFDASGAPTSGDFQVNSYTIDEQRLPAAALGDDGGYVVAWQSSQQDGFGFGIFAKRKPAPVAGSTSTATARAAAHRRATGAARPLRLHRLDADHRSARHELHPVQRAEVTSYLDSLGLPSTSTAMATSIRSPTACWCCATSSASPERL